MKCKLCIREAVEGKSDLCHYHTEAYKNLKEGFEKWRHAYGEVDWRTYLQKVAERPETGVWVKECCQLLLEKESAERL